MSACETFGDVEQYTFETLDSWVDSVDFSDDVHDAFGELAEFACEEVTGSSATLLLDVASVAPF
jgi:hypothetical protein